MAEVETMTGFEALTSEDQDELRKFERYLRRCADGAKELTAHDEVYEGIVFGTLVKS